MKRPPLVMSFVEDGWRSARVLSLALVQQGGYRVTHLIRGRVDPAVLRMITPCPGMRLVPIERVWFKVVRWLALVWALARRRAALLLVDSERTFCYVQPFARRWGVPVVLAEERFQQLLYRWDGQPLDASDVLRRLRERPA